MMVILPISTIGCKPTVTINAQPESIILGQSTKLSWTSTNGISASIDQGVGKVSVNGSIVVSPTQTTTYTIIVTGKDGVFSNASITINVNYPEPTVTFIANPNNIQIGNSSTLSWNSKDATNATIDQGIGDVAVNGSITVSPKDKTIYTIKVTGAGGTSSANITVNVIKPPTIKMTTSVINIDEGKSATLSWVTTDTHTVYIDNGIGYVPLNGSIPVTPANTTVYNIAAIGLAGNASSQMTVKVRGNPEPLPEGSFGKDYEGLIPEDATIKSYDSKRFSIITGIVRNIDQTPIEGVSVTVLNNPEYGTVYSDMNGRFSIPVEGGGIITLNYIKNGFITSNRQVNVRWTDIATIETVKMIEEDQAITKITFDGNPSTIATHKSTDVRDEFGLRSMTMVFRGDNKAYAVDKDGKVIKELSTIVTRATEFTTPESMPAELPPNSGFTYCVELKVDGAERVKFDKPVITWVDNFLGFKVGEIVPAGYYDRNKGVWIPSNNGLVVKLLDTNGDGNVDALDKNGDNQPDDLNNNGLFDDEVKGLNDKTRYKPGSTFWRVEVNHFTPWDYNWPYGPPSGAIAPNPESDPKIDQLKDDIKDCKTVINSFVEERNRTFHEDIPIAGTDLTLHYSSDRTPGYKYKIDVPASGETIPSELKSIIVQLKLYGINYEKIINPLPNQKVQFIWDGKDYNGRLVKDPVRALIKIGFVYNSVYYNPNEFEQSFAKAGCISSVCSASNITARQEIVLWQNKTIYIDQHKNDTIGRGWTISSHHYHPFWYKSLFKGDGTAVKNKSNIISVAAGNGAAGYSGDGGFATGAMLNFPQGTSVDPKGDLYIADLNNHRIRKVDSMGIITTVAGNGTAGYGGDGGPATIAMLNNPRIGKIDNSGNIYVVDTNNHRIRKVDSKGIITTVAGNGTVGYGGDGSSAINANLSYPRDVAIDASGNLYIADHDNQRIRKVDSNGIIITVAGNGSAGYSGDGGAAIDAKLNNPEKIAVDGLGNLYIADITNNRIRKVDNKGIISTFAGNGNFGYNADYCLATKASLALPHGIAVDYIGNLYIADRENHRIRKVDTNGIITTVKILAGNGDNAQLSYPFDVAVDPIGNLYISEYTLQSNCIRKVSTLDNIASNEFIEENFIHTFYSDGRHDRTIDLNTGVILRWFGYDQSRRLISITDQFGNKITIQRNSEIPTAIISPDGVTTELSIDTANHLKSIKYPDGSFYNFEYNQDGLMTLEVDGNGNRFFHKYDALGRITDVIDEEGGQWRYTSEIDKNGDILSKVITGEENLTTYFDHTDLIGNFTSTIIDAAGGETIFWQSPDGLISNKSLSCGMNFVFKYYIDSQYKLKYLKEIKEVTPSGLTNIILKNKIYEDIDLNTTPDKITEKITLNNKTTSFIQDTLQAQKSITSPEGRTIAMLYEPSNLLVKSLSIPGFYKTIYNYDSKGRITSINKNTRSLNFSYDNQGNIATIIDPKKLTTSYKYDLMGRITDVNRPDNSVIRFSYDKNGNISVLTNPSEVNHSFMFNKTNYPESYKTPLSGNYTYKYNKDRQLIQTILPSGKEIINVYDKTNLIQTKTPEGNIDFEYLCNSKVKSVLKNSESISYEYDGKLLISEILVGTINQSLSYTYNNDFNITSFTYAGNSISYSYDKDGLLIGIGDFMISRDTGNGLPKTVNSSNLSLSRSFNGYGEIDQESFTVAKQNLVSWNLTRDDSGKIITKAETIGSLTSNYSYTYDSMGRLLTVTKDSNLIEEYHYNKNGSRVYDKTILRNLSERAMNYSEEDHLLTAGTDTTYQYDVDGFLNTKTQDGKTTFYNYCSQGELLSVKLPDNKIIEYIHDPLGRRIAKKIDGVITEKYLWQGLTKLIAIFRP